MKFQPENPLETAPELALSPNTSRGLPCAKNVNVIHNCEENEKDTVCPDSRPLIEYETTAAMIPITTSTTNAMTTLSVAMRRKNTLIFYNENLIIFIAR